MARSQGRRDTEALEDELRRARESGTARKKSPPPKVLVAAENFPAGTILGEDDFRWQEWPEDGVNETYLLEEASPDGAKQFTGAAARLAILAGEPITEARVARPDGAGFLSAALTAGMRAATIKTDEVTGTGGFVFPGDRVAVILTATFDLGAQAAAEDQSPLRTRTISETILENVRVLAVDQSVNDLEGEPKISKTVTIELTPKQVEALAVARQIGQLSLALQSLAQPKEPALERSGFTQDIEISSFLSGRTAEGKRLQAEIKRRETLEQALAIAREETRQLTATYRTSLERSRSDRDASVSELEKALEQARSQGQRDTDALEDELRRAREARTAGKKPPPPKVSTLKIYRGSNVEVRKQ